MSHAPISLPRIYAVRTNYWRLVIEATKEDTCLYQENHIQN